MPLRIGLFAPLLKKPTATLSNRSVPVKTGRTSHRFSLSFRALQPAVIRLLVYALHGPAVVEAPV
jgi:hypothetical protein